MNTIETIRAEIERRMRKVHETSFNMEMKDLLSILDTLQEKSKKPINPTLQEQPVCEGLEEAAERYEHNRVYQDELDKYANYLDSLEEGETPRMEEPSPETKYLLNADMIESFKAGAIWQKAEMMKEAVDVTFKSGTMRVNGVETPFEGGKAKLIIIKKD